MMTLIGIVTFVALIFAGAMVFGGMTGRRW